MLMVLNWNNQKFGDFFACLVSGGQVDVIYTDFDKVPHQRLLLKLVILI